MAGASPLVIVATIVFAAAASSALAESRDGAWWSGAPETFKLGYVAGYLAGQEEQAAKWRHLTDEAVAQLPEDARTPFTPVLDMLRAETTSFDRATYGDVVSQLDGFYRLERNRAIPLAEALVIVRQALNGAEQPYLACQTEYFRLAHDKALPMKERLEALGKKASQCANMAPHENQADSSHEADEAYGLPSGHPETK